ncbi:MAG TPA: sulfotransferase [Caulobacter sp.]|nr:sulfotransferase [Caulobacter sp.]
MSGSAEHWRQIGLAASARRDHAAAVQAFERAARLAPGDPALAARLALERLTFGDIEGARRTAHAARAMSRIDPKTLDRLGHVFSRTSDFELAVDLFRQAAAGAPDDIGILRNLAWGAQHVGAFGEAEAALRRALALSPDDDKAWFSLSGLPGWRPSGQDIDTLTRLLDRLGADEERALGVGHALARAWEALGDWPAALAVLTRAKAARRRSRAYDVGVALGAFAAAPEAWRKGPVGPGDPTAAPIFVVGPPRSGTTLLDRILSSHGDVTSAGELRAMPLLALRAAGIGREAPITAEVMAATSGVPAGAVGRTYLEAAASLAGTTPRFTDKRPFNLMFAGMISRALPNARILRMRRRAADTVLGNYRQLFGTASVFHDYAYDLEDTARYVCGLETLSEAWEALLPPDRYLVIDYEALVADPERRVREILAFCGLEWDPACLDFHRNTAGVSTASAVQVREPLHDRNIGLWRRCGEGFEPALRILRAEGRLEHC